MYLVFVVKAQKPVLFHIVKMLIVVQEKILVFVMHLNVVDGLLVIFKIVRLLKLTKVVNVYVLSVISIMKGSMVVEFVSQSNLLHVALKVVRVVM